MTMIARFYPIVDSAEWVARLVSIGARLIQLRIKDLPPEELRGEIRRAKIICAAAGAQLIVNDYWQLALDEACDFIHLGQEDLVDADLPALRRAGMRVGISTHSHEELETALSADPDYVALGPIWPTKLKQMPWAPQGLDRVTEWKRLVGARPLVAIGGLTVERAKLCLLAGADSVAVVGDIVRHDDPVGQTRAWLEATEMAS
ncbi:MAG TPA: thiamine phosphate synthase [Devosiaceae bacterium]|nr:thiamine phosphate synthase [Devosiaceae bacterium]